MTTLPLDRRGRRILLVVNHEYTNENLMFRGFTSLDAMTVEQVRSAMAAHGLSVVELERVGDTGQWRPVTSGPRHYNRRITPSTRMLFTGPAAGSPLLRTSEEPRGLVVRGTLNNCAGGLTPWGTVLSGEENFNQYFVGADGVPDEAKPALARYGSDTANRYPSGSRKWDRVEARFDLTREPNEANRFGWVVEIDPYDPHSTPREHTALGRFKHEGAEIIIAPGGQAVAYMGDDERFDYIYKFVSSKKIRRGNGPAARAHNMTLLESGTLYVARFSFTSADEIDGSGRLPSEDGGDNAAETFTWTIPIVCGDPADPSTYFAGFDKSKVSPISCPDNLDFDAHGNLWISTDGNALGSNDGLFAVPVDGPQRGHVKQFLTVPVGAEEASAAISDDNRTVFVSVQHPGEIDGASVDNPASTWPHGDFARPAVINVWRRDGREIGR